ncbi:MAG: hypothetical protein ACTHOU_18745 [Aureliella sp.]
MHTIFAKRNATSGWPGRASVTARLTQRLAGLGLAVAALCGIPQLAAVAQSTSTPAAEGSTSPPQKQPSRGDAEQNDLTQGLLDLLTQPDTAAPASKSAQGKATGDNEQRPESSLAKDRPDAGEPVTDEKKKPAQTQPQPKITQPDGTPGQASPEMSRGLVPGRSLRGSGGEMGEDLGSPGQTHPLVEVEHEMLTAADWLRGREPVDRTEGLQRDILARLDQLIDDLEHQPLERAPGEPPSQPPAEQPKPRDGAPPPSPELADGPQQPQSTTSSSDQPATPDTASPPESEQPSAPAPGMAKRRAGQVDLSDPRALQQSAWGSLPDRVRDQMQSRMVERFLPTYREEIEAYYRALAK